MNNLSFNYGKSSVSLKIPEHATSLTFTEPSSTLSQEGFISQFNDLLHDQDLSGDIAIVVADKTRLCGYEQILPWITQVLNKKNVSPESITFYIAYGTHPRQSRAECISSYGSIYDEYRFIHHDCSEGDFVTLGATDRGTKVRVRADILNASCILTVGAVSHHYFAGFGGARKLIFPGLAEKSAIYANHRLFLDKQRGQLAPGCRPGNLENNPVASDLKQIHELLPNYSSVHGLLDSKGKITQFFFGKTYEDFLFVCDELDRYFKVHLQEQYDLVIASAGGYPKDINFIQSHKAIHHAAHFVADGGTLVVLAECSDGIGSKTFLPYFEFASREAAFAELSRNYVGNGGTALAMMEKTDRISIQIKSELEPGLCSSLNIKPIDIDSIQKLLDNHRGTMAYAINASMLVADL